MCKDKKRKRFQCRTRSWKCSVIISEDVDGPYYTRPLVHNYPHHDNIIGTMRCRDAMRRQACSTTENRLTARQIAMDVRREFTTGRRLSSDLRFIRRNRQGGVVPKTYREIVLDETSTESIIFRTDDNGVIVFSSDELIIAASTTKLVCVDGTFSRCPKTHYQLLTCHSV